MFGKGFVVRVAAATVLLLLVSMAWKAPVQRGALYAPMLENIAVTDARACVANVWCANSTCVGTTWNWHCEPYEGEPRIDCKCNYNNDVGDAGTVCIMRLWE